MAKLSLQRIGGGYGSVSSFNDNYALMEAAMENTLSRDGVTPNTMSADIDMNSVGRIHNLQDAVHGQEPVTLSQVGDVAGVSFVTMTQDNVAAVLWPQQAIETANGVTATELQFYFGDVRRYGAKMDSSTDDTDSFNDAVQSGYMAFCDQGIANIEGTIVLDGNDLTNANAGKHLRLTGQVVLQRFSGDATTPIIHVYGNYNNLEGNKAVIRQNLYDHPDGIVLLGQSPGEAWPGTTNVRCQNNHISGLKIVGPENTVNELETGSPGLYIHSAQRKLGDFVGTTTYKNCLWDMEVINCDVGVEFSSDANANSIFHINLSAWIKAAIYFNGSYANDLYGVKMESPLDNVTPSTTKRHAIHFADINSGVETGTGAYSIESAYKNSVQGWCELPDTSGSDPNKNVSLFTHTETGDTYGGNVISFPGGTTSGGIGIGGVSTDAAIGRNRVIAGSVMKDKLGIIELQNYSFRGMDDASGTAFGKDSWRVITGHKSALAESTQVDVFSLDAIGNNAAGAIFKMTYVAKAGAVLSVQTGEVVWAVWQESDGVRDIRKLSESQTSFDEAQILTPNCVVAEGYTSNYAKATLGFLTGAPAGTNLYVISWKCELMSTELEANADFDQYLKYL